MLLGTLAACLLLELLFRAMPVSSSSSMDYYIDAQTFSPPPHHSYVASGGWDMRHPQRLQVNNFGFVASRDFVANPDAVAFIGDSFVEASMLDAEDRPAEQLARALGQRPVYAMGVAGSSLLDYAQRMRFAATKFGVRDFVVMIEEGDVEQALCGSSQAQSRCYDAERDEVVPVQHPSAGGLKKILRHSAFAQYLTSQLKLDPGQLEKWRPWAAARSGTSTAAPASTVAADRAEAFGKIVDAFFAEAAMHRDGRLVLVLEDCTASGRVRGAAQTLTRQLLLQKAAQTGVIVVDTGPLYREFISRTGLSMIVSPLDHHWNGAATGLVAKHVAGILAKPAFQSSDVALAP